MGGPPRCSYEFAAPHSRRAWTWAPAMRRRSTSRRVSSRVAAMQLRLHLLQPHLGPRRGASLFLRRRSPPDPLQQCVGKRLPRLFRFIFSSHGAAFGGELRLRGLCDGDLQLRNALFKRNCAKW